MQPREYGPLTADKTSYGSYIDSRASASRAWRSPKRVRVNSPAACWVSVVPLLGCERSLRFGEADRGTP